MKANYQSDGSINFSDLSEAIPKQPVLPSLKIKGFTRRSDGTYDYGKISQYLLPAPEPRAVRLLAVDTQTSNVALTVDGYHLLNSFFKDYVAFVLAIGPPKAGKSFFLDKILNLAGVSGNPFSQIKNNGIWVWSQPFCRGSTRLFIGEVVNCQIGSNAFAAIAPFALISTSVFIAVQSQQNGTSSLNDLNNYVGRYTGTDYTALLNRVIMNLHRSPNSDIDMASLKNLGVIENYFLPNARAISYEGPNDSLRETPYSNTERINSDYITTVSNVFGQIYEGANYIRLADLSINGGILVKVFKILENASPSYRNPKHTYSYIARNLYSSTFNFCIIQYHDYLVSVLSAEEPQPLDDLLTKLSYAKETVLSKFNEFVLDENLHTQYDEKLRNHINEKEYVILEINAKKTIEWLQIKTHLASLKEPTAILAALSVRPDLDHDRVKFLREGAEKLVPSLLANSRSAKLVQELANVKSLIKQKETYIVQFRKSAYSEQQLKYVEALKSYKAKLTANVYETLRQIEKIAASSSLKKNGQLKTSEEVELYNLEKELAYLYLQAKNQQGYKPSEVSRMKELEAELRRLQNERRAFEVSLKDMETAKSPVTGSIAKNADVQSMRKK